MKTKLNTVDTVNVNGKEILDFTPQYDGQSAIVSLNVIQRLAGLLPVTSINVIKDNLISKLKDNCNNINTIEDYIKLLQDELDFHTTVNLLTMYEDNDSKGNNDSKSDIDSEYVEANRFA